MSLIYSVLSKQDALTYILLKDKKYDWRLGKKNNMRQMKYTLHLALLFTWVLWDKGGV